VREGEGADQSKTEMQLKVSQTRIQVSEKPQKDWPPTASANLSHAVKAAAVILWLLEEHKKNFLVAINNLETDYAVTYPNQATD